MTDLARLIQPAIPTPQQVPLLLSTPLVLEGGVPLTVLVGVAQFDTKRQVYFRLPNCEDKHTSILWQCGGYALMLTFVFDEQSDFEVTELVPVTPSFWFSDTFQATSDGSLQQGCCLQSLPGTYHFDVRYNDTGTNDGWLSIDPQIVVTPQ